MIKIDFSLIKLINVNKRVFIQIMNEDPFIPNCNIVNLQDILNDPSIIKTTMDTKNDLFVDSALDGNIENVQKMLNNPSVVKTFTSDYICKIIRCMITHQTIIYKDPEAPYNLTPELRISIIKSILSTPGIVDLIGNEQATRIFDVAINFGPSAIVEIFISIPFFLAKIDKLTILRSLQNHFSIDILSQSPDKWNLTEKDSSDVLRVLLDNEYIFSLIDSESAQRILQYTMSFPNAKSLSVIFNNQKLLDKIDNKKIRQTLTHIALIDDANLVSDILKNENITKYLLQEDWCLCYRIAKTDEIKELFEPYYYREGYFGYFARVLSNVYYSS